MADGLICTSLKSPNTETGLAEMAEAAEHADLIELRLDYMDRPDLPRLLSARPRPVIATCRPVREMGRYRGPESERIALLEQADHLGAEFIDIELDSASQFRRRGRARLIVSYHDFESTPADLDGIHARLVRAGADIPKLVTFAHSITDNCSLFHLLERVQQPTIGLCMGEFGQISRILAARFGSFLTFASFRAGEECAPGQIAAPILRALYRVHRIRSDTDIYGVVGNPVSHSLSPHLHNAAFEAAGLNKVYVPFLVGDVVEFLRSFRAFGLRGCSITIPHKEAALEGVDEVEPLARQIGAINTIVERGGRFTGHNTDCAAAVDAIEAALRRPGHASDSPLRGKRVVIVGAGGAGRAIAFGVRQRGGDILIANRSRYRADRLASDLRCKAITLRTLLKQGFEADVLVNASSAGMYPNVEETPVPRKFLRPPTLVFDAVYNPLRTRLLREAEETGCPTVSGLAMFIRQAAAQFELWTGHAAPRDLMEGIVRKKLEKRATDARE
ncbi:MAG: shikimate dehydrogenase [Planctomycetes bacterium]|nr:shikimate dehydrogenase [Planctomycetota bacterium]